MNKLKAIQAELGLNNPATAAILDAPLRTVERWRQVGAPKHQLERLVLLAGGKGPESNAVRVAAERRVKPWVK